MSDLFGIGVRVSNSIAEYSRLARGTGRSYVLSDMTHPNDLLVFSSHEHALEFEALHKRRGKAMDFYSMVLPPRSSRDELFSRLRKFAAGRDINVVHFDHMWLEDYYAHTVSQAMATLCSVASRNSSGSI